VAHSVLGIYPIKPASFCRVPIWSLESAQASAFQGQTEKNTPARQPINLELSPALRLHGKTKDTLAGRKVGILLGAGFDPDLKKELISVFEAEDAKAAIIARKIQGKIDSGPQNSPCRLGAALPIRLDRDKAHLIINNY
jgi:hypothetical protein